MERYCARCGAVRQPPELTYTQIYGSACTDRNACDERLWHGLGASIRGELRLRSSDRGRYASQIYSS